VVVGTPAEAQRWCDGFAGPVRRFNPVGEGQSSQVRAWAKAVRIHQWAKNALLFVPLLAAHRSAEFPLLARALLAFLSFGLCASSVYVLNDLLDLESDRIHPSKKRRPFAAGRLPVRAGMLLAPVLLAGAFTVALTLLPRAYVALLATYYVTTLAYSLRLKQQVMLDVLVLAGLYAARIFGGALAVGVPVSDWLLAFSMFLFLSLALVKRVIEVRRLRESGQWGARGRGYVATDLEQLTGLGTASGYLSVLVLALYITSGEVSRLYSHPARLWLLCPLMLFWVGRVSLMAGRGEVNEDPLLFALKDRVSYMVGLAGGLVLLLAA
jgi:4-hydroxybenzoate polyprenyltransferase